MILMMTLIDYDMLSNERNVEWWIESIRRLKFFIVNRDVNFSVFDRDLENKLII